MARDVRCAGAEGATAPETLRQMDRGGMTLWKADAPVGHFTVSQCISPKGGDPASRGRAGRGEISQV